MKFISKCYICSCYTLCFTSYCNTVNKHGDLAVSAYCMCPECLKKYMSGDDDLNGLFMIESKTIFDGVCRLKFSEDLTPIKCGKM